MELLSVPCTAEEIAERRRQLEEQRRAHRVITIILVLAALIFIYLMVTRTVDAFKVLFLIQLPLYHWLLTRSLTTSADLTLLERRYTITPEWLQVQLATGSQALEAHYVKWKDVAAVEEGPLGVTLVDARGLRTFVPEEAFPDGDRTWLLSKARRG